jgi:hypothetical protein
MQLTREAVLGGGMREFQQSVVDGAPLKLNGPKTPYGIQPSFLIKGGYAVTTVPKSFWERWSKSNQDIIGSGMIIAADTEDALIGKAKDFKELRSGLEPMLKSKDPRVPKPPANITIELAKEDD